MATNNANQALAAEQQLRQRRRDGDTTTSTPTDSGSTMGSSQATPASSCLGQLLRCCCKCGAVCCGCFVVLIALLFVFLMLVFKYGTIEIQQGDQTFRWNANDDHEWTNWHVVPGHRSLQEHYRTIGVKDTATREEIKAAYRELVFQYHPDRNPDCEECPDQFMKIQTAYEQIRSARHSSSESSSSGRHAPSDPSSERRKPSRNRRN
ncbi:hypothetical protein CAOG_03059 [Capsaspora owczarzaki ATCC 30864]|uniref:J domain-containing protein n=1 Tax=Capsaspora owczarzaki (strain ATCC 30864) TaxID=595528 RepID=A0A0D2WNM6_CAPO3|nr:hypothetical protein CAOG_03059 [Capsaspora owczarzaki ATCC 30864]KJE92023.1 hypothetical protein CAOG_003059 [Capsaspora owczarzaki ATCC 30864]|eukprot:XP_004363898.1 hypothetical protein CAOG_03059 [Capsaspora owczarzaki ATCC 30864]